jgi:two-component system sensor histidine kinase DctS
VLAHDVSSILVFAISAYRQCCHDAGRETIVEIHIAVSRRVTARYHARMRSTANPPPLVKAATGRYLQLSRLAFVLFVAAVGALLWLNNKAERDEQRATLISDMLWLDQNLQFALNRNEEHLHQISLELARPGTSATRFDLLARHLLENNSGIRQVMWFGDEGKLIAALPGPTDAAIVGETAGTVPSQETFHLAAALGKPAYSPAYAIVGGDAQFEVHEPQFRQEKFVGMIIGVYTVKTMLNQLVPWWLTERYRIGISDDSGNSLGAKTAIVGDALGPGYQIPFDPPGHGLILQATAYEQKTSLVRNLLGGALALLAAGVLWSLWLLRRHMLRRQAAESALREEHAFRKAMEDSVVTGLRARDLEGRITYVNAAFCRMVGYAPEEIIGRKPPMPYWDPDFIDVSERQSAEVLAGNAPLHGFEARLRHRDGRIIHTMVYAAPLIDGNGRHAGWLSSVVDITDQKRAEELAQQQQEKLQATARLVAMGEMASSLAHEINQPLAAISSYSAGILNQIRAGTASAEEMTATLDKVGQQARRAGQVIRRIYEFVRRSEPRRKSCDLRLIVDDAVGLVEGDASRHGIRIDYASEVNVAPSDGDPVLLAQVLVNLLRNGIEAMLQTPPKDRNLVVKLAHVADGFRVVIRDRGHGIAAEHREHLFDPFFTTKADGMGMGLNICRSIVESHHGRLWFEPNPDGGTSFYLVLPESTDA